MTKRPWYIYQIGSLSLHGWRSFGLRGERIVDNRDMSAMARAINLLAEHVPDANWYDENHEFWLCECPCSPPIVCVRRGGNPFDCGYIVSPVPMPHLSADEAWEKAA